MDLQKLLAVAIDLDLPDLVAKGQKLATDVAAYVDEVRANYDRAGKVMAQGTREDLDAIHGEAMAVSARLDAKLAEAEKR